MSSIFRPDRTLPSAHLGGKAGTLARLHSSGLLIPPWFLLLPEAFHISLSKAHRIKLESARQPDEFEEALKELILPPQIRKELTHALADLCPNDQSVAVRSSALEEDSPHLSFAGQLESFLAVRPADVPEKIIAVWRSAFSERVLAYRHQHQLPDLPTPPAVLVQRMVASEISGVAFAADPVAGRRGIAVVSAVFGLGTSLVSGEADSDTWRVDRQQVIVQRGIVAKPAADVFDPASPDDIKRIPTSMVKALEPALHDDQIRELAALVRRISKELGRPQEIEWAIETDRIYLLQARPITTLESRADPDGRLNIWDNSNIIESYSGVTTPLTFSFARHAYEHVYRRFCRMMGVPASTIAAHNDTFPQMLGLIRGRIYYNLLNWYRVLALLPGFAFNRQFMEQMMGLKEGLPQALLDELEPPDLADRIKDGLQFGISLGGLVLNYFLLPSRTRGFRQRLSTALIPPRPALGDMRADELVSYYHQLERQLLTRWDAPLVNDFFAMIFFGVLRTLSRKWCGDADGTLQNRLLCRTGGMISAEPGERLRELAELAKADPDFATLLREGSLESIQQAMGQHPDFRRRCGHYLEVFGERCFDELKLESLTLHEDPLPLLRAIGQLVQSTDTPGQSPASTTTSAAAATEQSNPPALRRHPLRRALFNWVLANARDRLRDRENLRFERTRLFGRVRRVFLQLGHRLQELRMIESPRDVLFLEVDELLGLVEGTSTIIDANGLIGLRKAEFARYREGDPPPNRFETRGMVHQTDRFLASSPEASPSDATQLSGLGCSPGIVRGPVRIVTDPRTTKLQPGEIAVAERTDPGWILLFASLTGLLVERGSLLSHSAIVARELAIPAIVAVGGVTAWLKDGDVVEMDGTTGIVRKLPPGPSGANASSHGP